MRHLKFALLKREAICNRQSVIQRRIQMLMKIKMAWHLINQRTSDRNSPLQSSLWFSIARFDRWPKHACKRRHPHTIKGSPSLHHIGKSANEIISLFNNSLFKLAARRSRQRPRLVKQRYPHPRIPLLLENPHARGGIAQILGVPE